MDLCLKYNLSTHNQLYMPKKCSADISIFTAYLVWEPHINFLVFEAWFTIAQSRLFATTNVYHESVRSS